MSGRSLFQQFITNARANLRFMMSSDVTSLSSSTPPPTHKNPPISSYRGLEQPPNLSNLKQTTQKTPTVLPFSIPVKDPDFGGEVSAFLHLPPNYGQKTPSPDKGSDVQTAAILLSGAGGGLTGPSSIYLSMGAKLASLSRGIPVLRMDYRYPARNRPCCQDVLSAMSYLATKYPSISKFVLVGWSFGAAPVFSVSGPDYRVSGAACVAPQTAETKGIEQLAPRPLLLLHGTGDRTLSPSCSESLYERYGSSKQGDRTIKLFPGDDHALTRNSLKAEELLCDFIAKCAGVEVGDREQVDVVRKPLVGDGKEKIELMRKGGDLRGKESVE